MLVVYHQPQKAKLDKPEDQIKSCVLPVLTEQVEGPGHVTARVLLDHHPHTFQTWPLGKFWVPDQARGQAVGRWATWVWQGACPILAEHIVSKCSMTMQMLGQKQPSPAHRWGGRIAG